MGITFKEIGDDCELCPLHKQDMCHGLANHGTGPVYPPCSELDEDTDVDEYLERLLRQRCERLKREQKQREERRAKEQKKELQRKRSRYSNAYCRTELERVNEFNKMIKNLEKALSDVEGNISVAECVEKTGGYVANIEELIKYRELVKARIMEADAGRTQAKLKLAEKREECRQSPEYLSIS